MAQPRNNYDLQVDMARRIFMDYDQPLLIEKYALQTDGLIMSLIKREYGIKDYGKLFPGHGGVLDRFDSILAVSLAFAVICIFAKMVNLTLI